MDTAAVARRHFLRRVGLAAGGGLATTVAIAAPVHASGSPGGESSLTGAWMTERADDDGYRARGIFTFSSGGVVHYQDIFPANSLLHGSWATGSRRSFRYETWGAIVADPATGAPALTVRVSGTGTWRGDTFINPYVLTAFDGATGTEIARFPGTATGTRIVP